MKGDGLEVVAHVTSIATDMVGRAVRVPATVVAERGGVSMLRTCRYASVIESKNNNNDDENDNDDCINQ